LCDGNIFEWVWTEAHGHSGGTLIGVRTDDITVIDKDKGEFFSSMSISSKQDNFNWEIINVYGPVHSEKKEGFLDELSRKVSRLSVPFIIGGDFNMIRFTWEKSSGNVTQMWMDAFNDFIRDNGIKEMMRKGNKFTWTNKQINHVMSVLDRVLVCPRWEQWYRKASCETLTRVGSDHCPILVNTDDHRFK
jgi:exonuclease III